MTNLIKEKPTNRDAISALKTFNSRQNEDSTFGTKFNKFWEEIANDKISRRIEKRRLETVEQLNNDTCEEIESISRRIRRNVSRRVEEDDIFSDIINITKNVSSELDKSNVLLSDDEAVKHLLIEKIGEDSYSDLNKKTSLEKYNSMSNPCKELIRSLVESPPSPTVIRKILRKSTLGEEDFDPIVHADLNFVEVTSVHFLNLITSPRNPIQHVALERTAASLTTVQILNCLFLSNNDILDLNWFEKECKLVKNTKWDGIAFCLQDKRFTPVLVEFSGGFDFNTTSKKENDDENKLVDGINEILKYNDALGTMDYPIPQFYVRFFGRQLTFESICLLKNGKLVKRHYFTINCPATCGELIELASMYPKLLDWKQTIINHAKRIIKKK